MPTSQNGDMGHPKVVPVRPRSCAVSTAADDGGYYRAYDFDLLPVAKSPVGLEGKRVRDHGQPVGVLVELAKSGDVAFPGQQKIDGAIELVIPLAAAGDGFLLNIDEDDRSGRNHGLEGAVLPADDAAAIVAWHAR